MVSSLHDRLMECSALSLHPAFLSVIEGSIGPGHLNALLILPVAVIDLNVIPATFQSPWLTAGIFLMLPRIKSPNCPLISQILYLRDLYPPIPNLFPVVILWLLHIQQSAVEEVKVAANATIQKHSGSKRPLFEHFIEEKH